MRRELTPWPPLLEREGELREPPSLPKRRGLGDEFVCSGFVGPLNQTGIWSGSRDERLLSFCHHIMRDAAGNGALWFAATTMDCQVRRRAVAVGRGR